MSYSSKGQLCPKKSFVILCYRTPEPELGSPYIGLLRGQLEYWFSKHPKSFYKFLEPCKHPLYRVGDSWTEELGFSRPIFNRVFDIIGVRYKSKTAFMSAEDKFQGKLYASYHDRKTNRTFFVRNLELLQQQGKSLSAKKAHSISSSFETKAKVLEEKHTTHTSQSNKGEGRNNNFSHNRSRNETNQRSCGGIIGGKKNNITEITSFSSLSSNSLSSDLDEKKKIAEEMKNIWMEEIGEIEVNHLTTSLVSRLNQAYTAVLTESLENWRTYCRKIASSKFLMGEGSKSFKAWLSWAIKPESYERIQAGEFILGDRKVKEKAITLSREEEAKLRYELINSSKHPIWIKASLKLIERVGGHIFKQWFRDADLKTCTAEEVQLKGMSRFCRDYIERNYRTPLIEALQSALGTKEIYLSYSV